MVTAAKLGIDTNKVNSEESAILQATGVHIIIKMRKLMTSMSTGTRSINSYSLLWVSLKKIINTPLIGMTAYTTAKGICKEGENCSN